MDLSGAALVVGSDALREAIKAHRSSDGEALGNVTAHLDQYLKDVAMLDTFGGSTIGDTRDALNRYLERISSDVPAPVAGGRPTPPGSGVLASDDDGGVVGSGGDD